MVSHGVWWRINCWIVSQIIIIDQVSYSNGLHLDNDAYWSFSMVSVSLLRYNSPSESEWSPSQRRQLIWVIYNLYGYESKPWYPSEPQITGKWMFILPNIARLVLIHPHIWYLMVTTCYMGTYFFAALNCCANCQVFGFWSKPWRKPRAAQGWCEENEHRYGSIPISTMFRGMNIHLPAILMFTRGTRFWHTAT